MSAVGAVVADLATVVITIGPVRMTLLHRAGARAALPGGDSTAGMPDLPRHR
ncbi:hypothetical protein [Geodermatophilus sp. SYSU D01176]